MNLSVALATYSGEDTSTILSCINAVYNWVDEIIIVYGSPKDEKITAIEKLDIDKKIKYIFTDNPPMFHINKQKAIDACNGDWILQLDIDEIVSPELRDEIVKVTSNELRVTSSKYISSDTSHDMRDKKQDVNGYWIPRLNYFLGRPLTKGGQYPDPTIRLYRNGKGRLACKSVHEQAEIEGKVGYLKNNLLHYPWPTIEEYISKALVRYSILEASELYKQGVRPSLKNTILYIKILPVWWFFKTYFRHRGYVDGYSGFIFSLFSALRYWVTYAKLIEISRK